MTTTKHHLLQSRLKRQSEDGRTVHQREPRLLMRRRKMFGLMMSFTRLKCNKIIVTHNFSKIFLLAIIKTSHINIKLKKERECTCYNTNG